MWGRVKHAGVAASLGVTSKLRDLVFPAVPPEIAGSFESSQMMRVLRHVPMIYAVATLNMVIVITLCIEQGMPIAFYGWMFFLTLFAIVRMFIWIGRARGPLDDLEARPLLLNMTIVSVGGMGMLSIWTAANFVMGYLDDAIVIPVSLVFGATCVAHCLAPLRTAAAGTLIAGILPTAAMMIGVGDFQTKLLGVCMLTIAGMMLRFVSEQYDQLVRSLLLESQIREQAYTDALTGIPNRRAMMDALHSACARRKPFAVALLDLDGFKAVNDSLGHHMGDLLIQHVGQTLQAAKVNGDLVGRLGGDEFIILMNDVKGSFDASTRVSCLMIELCRPAMLDDHHQVPVAASLGFALYPDQGSDSEALLIAADRALYAEKRARQSALTQTLEKAV